MLRCSLSFYSFPKHFLRSTYVCTSKKRSKRERESTVPLQLPFRVNNSIGGELKIFYASGVTYQSYVQMRMIRRDTGASKYDVRASTGETENQVSCRARCCCYNGVQFSCFFVYHCLDYRCILNMFRLVSRYRVR